MWIRIGFFCVLPEFGQNRTVIKVNSHSEATCSEGQNSYRPSPSQMICYVIMILNWTGTYAFDSNSIENEIVGEPTVDCKDSFVGLTFKTKKPFTGRVYVYGMAGDDKCSRAFIGNQNQSRLSMHFKNGECTMQRQRITGQIQGLLSSLVVVISFHGTFVTKADRAYKCICFFRSQETLKNAIEMSPIGATELLNTLPTPKCSYSIHTESPVGPVVMISSVGEKIYHVWQCDSLASGFLVHSCSVSDGRGEKVDLIDLDGCAIDPAIQPDVLYEDDNMAIVEVYGYKFSDATVLNYECVVEICLSPSECKYLIPPKCDKKKDKIATHLRSPRHARPIARVMGSKHGQIEVAATLTMEDSMDPNTLAVKDSTQAITSGQANSSSSSAKYSGLVCLPVTMLLISATLVCLVFAASIVIVFYVARYQTYVVNPKL